MTKLTEIAKYIFGIFFLGIIASFFVIAAHDLQFYSSQFMQDNEIKVAKRIDDLSPGRSRKIASYEKILPRSFSKDKAIFANLDHRKINGIWNFQSYTNEKAEITKINIKAHLELKENYDGSAGVKVVKLAGLNALADEMDILYFSELSHKNALIYLVDNKSFSTSANEFIIFEAERNLDFKQIGDPNVVKPNTSSKTLEDYGRVKNVNLLQEMDLNLIEVVPRGDSSNILKGERIEGSLRIAEDRIEGLNINFSDKKIGEVNLEIRESEIISNYFQYMYDNETQLLSGVINRSNEDEYMITFVNGPLIGTKLKFVSERLKQKIEENSEIEDNQNLGLDKNKEMDDYIDYDEKYNHLLEIQSENSSKVSEHSLSRDEEQQNAALIQRYQNAQYAKELSLDVEENAYFDEQDRGFSF